MARPLHKADYNVLIITYTGDVGAPPYDDGMCTTSVAPSGRSSRPPSSTPTPRGRRPSSSAAPAMAVR